MNPNHKRPTVVSFGEDVLDRMEQAVLKVRERLLRSTAAFEAAAIPYAVVGGNAVAVWVAKNDSSAVRNTPDVDILIGRVDFDRARSTLEAVGFVHHDANGLHAFLDGPNGKVREALHIIFAGEKTRDHHLEPAPDLSSTHRHESFNVLNLEPLVRMKLTADRLHDKVHVRDMIDVGLIDATWPAKFIPELGARLQHLLDTPDG